MNARRLVTLHYHWVLLKDFLPRVLDSSVLDQVVKHGPKFYKPKTWAFIPVEFSAAAYRFGHTMVREKYRHNRIFNPATLQQLFTFTGLSGTAVPVPSNWPIDWRRFFDTSVASPDPRNVARKVDALLSPQLGNLPIPDPDPQKRNLAVRNLIRGNAFGLPSGQSVAKKMGLQSQMLKPSDFATGTDDAAAAKLRGFDKKTPLWYYILKEAEVRGGGEHLGPVGSRSVAEVFVGLLSRGTNSRLAKENKNFKPSLGPTPGQFTMANLLEFVGELNPVG
jgi:hypothetical protein